MPHISKSRLNVKVEKEITETFNMVLTHITQDAEMKEFLNSILSPTETVMLSKRLAIVLLLNEAVPASTIAAVLHVTRETVSRIDLLSQIKGKGYETAVAKIQKNRNVKLLKNTLLKLAGYTVRAAGGYVKPEIF